MKNFVKLNIEFMAFRNHFYRPTAPPPVSVVEQSLKSSIVDGVETFVIVDVDTSTRPPLPSMDDYRLSALLACGAPLNYVSPTIFENPDMDADHFVSTLLAPDNVQDVSRETDDNQIDTTND